MRVRQRDGILSKCVIIVSFLLLLNLVGYVKGKLFIVEIMHVLNLAYLCSPVQAACLIHWVCFGDLGVERAVLEYKPDFNLEYQ